MSEKQEMNDIAEALQQFQAAMDALKKAGILTENLVLPTITRDNTTKLVSESQKVDDQRVQVGEDTQHLKARKTKVLAPDTVDAFITWFCTAPIDDLYNVRRGQWECVCGAKDGKLAAKLLFHSKVKSTRAAGHIICMRPLGSDLVLFNASRITYGRGKWRDQKHPQAVAEQAGAIPIPFEVIKAGGEAGAGLDLDKLEIVSHAPAEQLLIPPVEKLDRGNGTEICQRHFAGATVLRINKDHFLFDCDREELKHFGFNPFFTRLPEKAETVEEAYDAMMPEAVKKAIADGLKVQRQGEFFFVPVDDVTPVLQKCLGKHLEDNSHRYTFAIVLDKLMQLGIYQMLGLNKRALDGLVEFREYCKKEFNGYIPLVSKKASEHDLEDTIAPYILGLRTAPKIELNWSSIAEDYTRHRRLPVVEIKNGNDNNAQALERELISLLTDGNNQRWTYGEIPGPLGSWGVKVNHSLGVTDDNGNTRGRHSCTAMVVGDGVTWATGVVSHGGREHRPVWLPGWHAVYANLSTSNWTVSGNVD